MFLKYFSFSFSFIFSFLNIGMFHCFIFLHFKQFIYLYLTNYIFYYFLIKFLVFILFVSLNQKLNILDIEY